MRKLKFTKMVASGNDFVVLNYELPACRQAGELRNLSMQLCNRKYGVGADGMLLLSKSRNADVKMRIFNADGSEAEMCGNGARCVALFVVGNPVGRLSGLKDISIETKAGIIRAEINKDNIKIKLTDPKDIRKVSYRMAGRTYKADFINTGVPHTVVFVGDIDLIDVVGLGRQIRYNKAFVPEGTNVDFVDFNINDFNINKDFIEVRTYERGVEGETLACGTGSVAVALIASRLLPISRYGKIKVKTKSGEILKVYFERELDKFHDVWLEGKASVVYKGEYYV